MTNTPSEPRPTNPNRSDEPDYRVFATIEDPFRRVERVPCDIFLPTAPGEPARAMLYPSAEQMNELRSAGSIFFEFRLIAEIERASDQNVTLTAPIAYARRRRSVLRGRAQKEYTIEAEILELVVTTCGPTQTMENPEQVEGFFRIVGGKMLLPPASVLRDWLEYKIEPFGHISATLASGTKVVFDRMLAYRDQGGGLFLTQGLTAHFVFEGDLTTLDRIETVRKELDDYLLVSSFGARDFGRCVSWRADDPCRSVEGFVAILPWLGEASGEPLIEASSFGAFCQAAYNSLSTASDRESLRQALVYVAPKDPYISKHSFVRLYSALETLVQSNSRASGSAVVLQRSEFKALRKFLSSKIDEYEPLGQREDERHLIKAKLLELNRISFGDAFNRLCSTYAIVVNDLWPVHGPPREWPLSQLRNKIVHGDLVRGTEERAVLTAEWHLRWTVERILLAMLKLPVEGTSASAEQLSVHRNLLYSEWKADRIILQEANVDQDV